MRASAGGVAHVRAGNQARDSGAVEALRLADAIEAAAWDLVGGADTFGDRCRRCGLGSVARLRGALAAYRRFREAPGGVVR